MPHIHVFITYVFNLTIVIKAFFRHCKKVLITHLCDTENGSTFSNILQEYLGFLMHIKNIYLWKEK